MPEVSVIMIFHNAARFISEAVASLVNQSHEDWELLVVDDGSVDGSTVLAKIFAAGLPGKIRFLTHPGGGNRGTSASRNLGFANARGEFVIRLDSDDVFATDTALAEQVALLRAHPQAAVVYGPCQYWRSWDGAGVDSESRLSFSNELVPPPRLLARMIEFPDDEPISMIARRSAIEAVGGCDVAIRDHGEDFVLVARLSLAYNFFASDRCWYRYRMHEQSYSHRTAKDGSEVHNRRLLGRWLERFLRDSGVRDPDVWAACKRRLAPLRHPRFDRFVGNLGSDLEWVSTWLRLSVRNAMRLASRGVSGRLGITPADDIGADGLCTARVSWDLGQALATSVRIGAPAGPALARSSAALGHATTRRWVSDRMLFFLQDETAEAPETFAATLHVARVRIARKGPAKPEPARTGPAQAGASHLSRKRPNDPSSSA